MMETVIEFYDAISGDARIGCSHISLYMALLYLSSISGGSSPLIVYREQILCRARISRRTFNKCMADMVRYGYISYEPSFDPKKGSRVFLKRL